MIASNFVPGLNVVGKAAKAARATYKAVSTARATYRVAKTAVKTNAKRAASRTLHVTKTVGTKSIRKAKKVTATVKAKARQRFTRKSQAKTSGSSTVSQRNVKTETRSQSSENAKGLNEPLKLDLQFFADKGNSKPLQNHHYATNKSKKYTPIIENITKKYNLNLDDAWNKEYLPHQGRHPNAYHDYVVDNLRTFDNLAKGDKDNFLKMFEGLKSEIRNNPDMLYKDYWRLK